MTRHRVDDHSTYSAEHDRRPSPWNALDTVAQRIVAIAAAAGILLMVVAWVGRTLSTEERLKSVEAQLRVLSAQLQDTHGVVCFLALKSDQPIAPPSCKLP